jgi:hypothetical protein
MTALASAWQRLPEMLRSLPQWALAGASKAPLSIDASGKLYNTSVNRPSEWLSFDKAVAFAEAHSKHKTVDKDKESHKVEQVGLNIGFILNEADPFTCIDLDVKDFETHPNDPELWTKPEQFDFYWNVACNLDSYTERSRSGKGLHIWLQGKIGQGFRRDGIEVYSQERFIICTGDIVLDRPVENRQAMLTNMVSQMRPTPKDFCLEEVEEDEDDWSILQRASNASNADKFLALWAGDWKTMGYPSQSEADLSLISILAFYSKSNAQCRRIFRTSRLGQREKAQKNDRYLNYTLSLIRSRQDREEHADLSAILQAAQLVQQTAQKRGISSLHVSDQQFGEPSQPPPDVIAAGLAPVSNATLNVGEEGIPWPPGLTGHIAKFVYQSAPRPVKEVAIVSALGLLAGICGKAWHIPGSGLNLYIILVARSAIGKEAMHSGISSIIKACGRENPLFHKFVDFTEYASGPALIKACVVNQCFVNVSGEWGRKLKRIAMEDGRDGALQTLRTQMTNLYQKSGPAAIVGGIGYSATDNNVASVAGVSYSLIGETTPGTFYEALTESMMEDGFLSRFLVIEYEGDRPKENEQRLEYPDAALVRALNNMSTQADMMITKDYSHPVARTEEAARLMKKFEDECDLNINATQDETKRQMWNRASLKSLRIAALLAVADNWMSPCVTKEHIEWAHKVLYHDISIMQKRLESGDVGNSDDAREKKLVKVIKDYLSRKVSNSYRVPDGMREAGIVTRAFLQIRTNRSAAFNNHKLGANKSLEDSIQTMIANGYLVELDKNKIAVEYSFHGRAYRAVKLPEYNNE